MLRTRIIPRMPSTRRLAISIAVAALSAAYVLISPALFPGYHSDFDQLWAAATAWRAGQNPYETTLATHRALGFSFGLLYPFGAVVVALPVSFLPLEYARAVVVAIMGFGFAFLLLGRAWWLFPILLSASMRSSVSLVQLAPFVACAVMVPAFGWVMAVKPNVGVMAWVAQRDRGSAARFLLPALIVGAVSLIAWPSWPSEWIAALGTADHLTPMIFRPFGWLLVLAVFRWRDPAARWLLALAVLPGTPAVHDALPLLVLLPRSLRQALVLALLSHVADIGGYWLAGPSPTMPALAAAHATMLLWSLYVPALLFILIGTPRSERPGGHALN